MSRRQGFIDEGFGERRGVVLLDGKPERLVIERDDDFACQRLGARSAARVRTVERGQGIAFLSLPEGPDGVAPIGRLAEGQAVEVEVAAEARDEKGPSLTVVLVFQARLAQFLDLIWRRTPFASTIQTHSMS